MEQKQSSSSGTDAGRQNSQEKPESANTFADMGAKRREPILPDDLDANGTYLGSEDTSPQSEGATLDPGTASGAGGTAAVVGATGGTDASAGAKLSGSKGGPGGTSLREQIDASGAPGTPGGTVEGDVISPAAGAAAAGGTGLGSSESAGNVRNGTGTTSSSGTGLTGGGMSGARDAGISQGR